MSDMISTPFDAAIDLLRERERQLDTEAQSLIIRRDEVREMIAVPTISRKPRAPRKPRAVTEAPDVQKVELLGHALSVLGTLNVDNPHDPKNRTVFAPCVGDVPQEAA